MATAIVRAVTTMAQALDVPVVAEGIEDAEAHAVLLQMGCTSGQGWYFGKPMTGEQAVEFVRGRMNTLPSEPSTSPIKIAS